MVRLTDRLDMTIFVDWDVKPQIKQTNKLIKRAVSVVNSLLSSLSVIQK